MISSLGMLILLSLTHVDLGRVDVSCNLKTCLGLQMSIDILALVLITGLFLLFYNFLMWRNLECNTTFQHIMHQVVVVSVYFFIIFINIGFLEELLCGFGFVLEHDLFMIWWFVCTFRY